MSETYPTGDINATYNWWGTTETQTIDQTIHDNKDDFNLGTVNYAPILTAPNPQTPSISTPTNTPAPSASIPEYTTIILLMIILAVTSITILYKTKTRN